MLSGKNINLVVKNKKLLDSINFSCQSGQIIALCGPNGAGKSSLLKVLAGDLQAQQGDVFYNQKHIDKSSAMELAKCRAVMPQNIQVSFDLTVRSVIEMGLLFCPTIEEKNSIVQEISQWLDVSHLLTRLYNVLSGGEQQRVQLARVISQMQQRACAECRYLLLDECTSAMDMAMMHKAFAVLRNMTKHNIGIVAVVHDLNLASLYADHIIMLKEGKSYAEGCPHTVMTQEIINSVFQASVEVIQHPTYRKPVILQNMIQAHYVI